MEGLIPMVYKTIKKSRTRRHYEYLGSAASPLTATQSYNISDFYPSDDHYITMKKTTDDGFNTSNAENIKGRHHNPHHRRYKSFQVDYRPEDTTVRSNKLVRFRSHRFFSCVTGA